MSRYTALREGVAKPEYARHAGFAALKSPLERIVNVGEQLASKRAELERDARLSDVGRAEQLRDIATLHAPAVARAARMLAKARAANQEKRTALAPVIKNPDSPVEEMQRQEIRAYLRTKSPAEAIAIVFAENAQRLVVESVLEAPTFLHGVPAERVAELRNAVAERTGGAAMEALREEMEALNFAGAAIDDALDALNAAAGFNRGQYGAARTQAFDGWFKEAAGASDEPAERSEFAKALAETTLANAKALGLDYDGLKTLAGSVSAGLTDLQLVDLKKAAA